MDEFLRYGLKKSNILLPGPDAAMEKWAVVACDQYTSQPEYWDETARIVGEAPSTLHMIVPECRLGDAEPEPETLWRAMQKALDTVLTRAVEGFVLVERQTDNGCRLGLLAAVDLAAYDYAPGATPLIRATEGTVTSRLPARMKVRRGAPLEIPHVLLLADDPKHTLIEPLYARREALPALYDFELMQGGGHIRGWAVTDDRSFAQMDAALSGLLEVSGGFLFAVGDGNHSLAAARACWVEAGKPDDETRYALVEIENLHDPSLVFEPIHRAVFGADCAKLAYDFVLYCRERGMSVVSCAEDKAQMYLLDAPVRIENARNPLPLAILQPFLDEWIAKNPGARIDYIHGRAALDALNCCRIRLTAMDKSALFPAVRIGGALPRKTFSMGEAHEKRYYLECRKLRG